MTYEDYRDRISELKAEYAVAFNANKKLYDDISHVIDNILKSDIDSVSLYDIDLNYLKTVNVEKLAKDENYKKEVLYFIDNEIQKLCLLLDGVLK